MPPSPPLPLFSPLPLDESDVSGPAFVVVVESPLVGEMELDVSLGSSAIVVPGPGSLDGSAAMVVPVAGVLPLPEPLSATGMPGTSPDEESEGAV